VPDDWKIKGEERRKLFRRYIDLQMRHVHEEVFKYVSEVRSDLCIADITEDIPDIMFYAFSERPKDPKVVEEMRKIWNRLTEKEDGSTNETGSLSRPEQAGFN
jgi:hypothetical protein